MIISIDKIKRRRDIRSKLDWYRFRSKHPELIIEKRGRKITNIIFPPEAEVIFLFFFSCISNNLCSLHYIYNGKHIIYESYEARYYSFYELLYAVA